MRRFLPTRIARMGVIEGFAINILRMLRQEPTKIARKVFIASIRHEESSGGRDGPRAYMALSRPKSPPPPSRLCVVDEQDMCLGERFGLQAGAEHG